MDKKSIGSFIAALRKTNGMTQQEVADRLNVSNKTVSKWERDESYPEITLIPVIAELFNVTSDEILRGERISRNEEASDKPGAKTDKLVKRMLTSSITKYKNMTLLSLALSIAGLVCLFTIYYAFYRPVLAYGIFLIFIIASILLEIIQFNNSNMPIKDNELFEGKEELLGPFLTSRNRLTLTVILANIAAVIFSLPLLLFRDSTLANSVILIRSYIILIPLLGIVTSLVCRLFYRIAKRNNEMQGATGLSVIYPRKMMDRMNLLHGCLLAIQYFIVIQTKGGEAGKASGQLAVFALFLPGVIIIISLLVFIVLAGGGRGKVLFALAGIRNMLYGYIGLYLSLFLFFRMLHGGSYIFAQFPVGFYGIFWVGLLVTLIYDIYSYKIYHKRRY